MRAEIRNVSMSLTLPALLALELLMAGCVTGNSTKRRGLHEGDVMVRVIEGQTANTYPAAKTGEGYSGAFPYEDNASPVYPPDQLAKNLPPFVLRVRLLVDESGNVSECLDLGAAAESRPEFFAAVRGAVLTWRFAPLVKMYGGTGMTHIDDHGTARNFVGRAEALPFHQDYEFEFSQRNGEGIVSGSTNP
jgi:hypothetical protein